MASQSFFMEYSTLIGSIGVSLLLLAFFFSLFKIISQESNAYLWLNLVGACIAAYASWLIHYIPFVVLECAWTMVALGGILKKRSNRGRTL
jgi:uncharacterized protein with PQ loop repeat